MGARKDVVPAASRVATPGQHLTKAPGPRVLIERFGEGFGVVDGRQVVVRSEAEDLAERLRQGGVPTVEVAPRLGNYNLNEWDCLITRTPPLDMRSEADPHRTPYEETPDWHSWNQEYPPQLSLICVQGSGGLDVLDAYPPESEARPDLPDVVIVRDPDRVGTQLRKINGLRDSLDALVSRELVPVAQARARHMSFRRWIRDEQEDPTPERLPLTPFLLGPDDLVLAGSYQRSDEASAWLLPDDLPDLYPWVIEALRDWHDLYPKRFPTLPDWQGSDEWRTAAESAIASAQDELSAQFKAQYDEFLAQQKVLEAQAEDAANDAAAYQRALLRKDGPELERAVERAIQHLGFRVVDMDSVHPEGDRREDLRVYDDTDPNWVAIVEIKGGKGGAKENELHAMGKWATRFAADEGRVPSAQWFLVNHQRFSDPTSRPVPFGGKPAVAQTFADVGGSIIDTRALFDLVRIVETDPTLASAARALIKEQPPTLTRVRVEDLDQQAAKGEA
jgi:hypothetical protein